MVQMPDNDLGQFIEDLSQEVLSRSSVEDSESFLSEAFTSLVLDDLEEEGITENSVACHYRTRGMEVSGYALDRDEGRLDLFSSIYSGTGIVETVPTDRIMTAFKRLGGFLEAATNGLQAKIDESSPTFDMAQAIQESRDEITDIRFFVLSDGNSRIERLDSEVFAGHEIPLQVWDINRIHRLRSSGQAADQIDIVLSELGCDPIPCLRTPNGSGEYDIYLALFPGHTLFKIYETYGRRLLERNVRSFLQARGKVNRGIRDTIRNEPEKFLAYNNGISTVAEAIETEPSLDGGLRLTRLVGFQIVNGGQTTASIFSAGREKADLQNVSVQAKLTVVDSETAEEVVPFISRYSNTQNRISEADFSANDPFHIGIERLSKSVWAPAFDGSQRQTRWFYERSRGAYQDEMAKSGTPARRREFQRVHPNSQKFTKTDLAKFENAWNQLPHIVSLGAQKSFSYFTRDLAERRGFEPDRVYFERLVAKAILFRQTEKIVQSQSMPGYRANIVAYTIGWLSRVTAQRIDLDQIWQNQKLPDTLRDAIDVISRRVREFILDAPGNGNVTEWCKRERCWEGLNESLDSSLADPIKGQMVRESQAQYSVKDGAIQGIDRRDQVNIDLVSAVSSEKWFELAQWARETDNLQGWQRSLAFNIGRRLSNGQTPSRRMAQQGVKILEVAQSRGFQDS